MNLRHNKKYLPIGLDIGSTALRAVQLCRDGFDLHVHAALSLPRPQTDPHASTPDNANQQVIAEPTAAASADELTAQLRRLIDHGGFVGRDVILHCPADKLDMRPMDLPAGPQGLPPDAVAGAVKLQIDQLPAAFDQTVFDHFTLGYDSRTSLLRVMAVIADAQWIHQRLQLITQANLRCRHIDALPCSLARLLQNTSPNPDEPHTADPSTSPCESLTGIVDIGLNGSTLVISNPAGPVFSRRFPLAGQQITNMLAQRLLIDLQHAERIKKDHGIDWHTRHLCTASAAPAPAPANDAVTAATAAPLAQAQPQTDTSEPELAKAIYAALQSELHDYAQALTRALNYVVTNRSQAQLQRILLTGSAAHLKNLTAFLTEQFELPVQLLDHPLLQEITDALPPRYALAGPWTTALGLALYQGDPSHGSR